MPASGSWPYLKLAETLSGPHIRVWARTWSNKELWDRVDAQPPFGLTRRGLITEWWAESQETQRLTSALPLMNGESCYKTDTVHTPQATREFPGNDSLVSTLEFPLLWRAAIMGFLPALSYHCTLPLAMAVRTLWRPVSAAEREQGETCAEKGSTIKTERAKPLGTLPWEKCVIPWIHPGSPWSLVPYDND